MGLWLDRSRALRRIVLVGGCALSLTGMGGPPSARAAQTAAQTSHAGPQSEAAPAPFMAEEYVIGAATAPVTIVEYLSVTCSHCAAFQRETWPRVRAELIDSGRVRFVIREMPTAPVVVASAGFLLARCAGADRYAGVVDGLLAHQDRILKAESASAAIHIETEISGLSEGEAQLCLSDPTAIEAMNARREQGLARGIDSTPFFLIDGRPLEPGANLSGEPYLGGELSFRQLLSAISGHVAATRRRPR